MEDMTPTLRLILCLREGMERGESVRFCLAEFSEQDESDLKFEVLRLLHASEDRSGALRTLKDTEKSLFGVIRRALNGEPISAILKELETDMVERSEMEIDEFTQKLSFRCLLPLLLLVFPGYLFLLLGPLLETLLRSFQ